jgi:hypothetical protein
MIGITLTVGILALSAPASYACYCLVPNVPEAFDKARDVFVGVVTEIIEPRSSDKKAPAAERFFTIKFRVERSFKGRLASEISVLADQGRSGCFSYPTILKGEKYLVYADQFGADGSAAKDLVTINACNRTGLVGEELKDRFFDSGLGERHRAGDLRELEEITNSDFNLRFKRPL